MIKVLGRSLLIVLAAASAAFADAEPPARTREDPDLGAAHARIKARDWPGAVAVMQKAVARDPGNADYHNLLAYALRNSANPDMAVVFKHYGEALRIDPKHKGAHEYIGEAYLMTGDVARAREHLAALNKLCFFSCAEYRDLKQAIEEHEARRRR
jgi:Flp pilus assembly protein TadD